MRRALQLARRGIGATHPNPRVGAVVVADGRIIGEGWHERPGLPHAEALALQTAAGATRGATLYVTLEPCAAHGRTPPCTEAILAADIARLVYASSDPHPAMAGGGELLRDHGLEVRGGVLQDQADDLNAPFFHYLKSERPLVTAKAAISLDGKLATHRLHSQWISNELSRRHAHRLRAASDAIIIGVSTLVHDNPSLTVRRARRRGEPPLRVVIGHDTPEFRSDYQLLDTDAPSRLYVNEHNEHSEAWRRAGVEVVQSANLEAMLHHLADDGRLSLLVEGGGGMLASFFEARLADRLVLYQAPILIGGKQSVSLWQGAGVARVQQAPRLENIAHQRLGQDQVIQGSIVYPDV